jgi:hypothetical protein
VAHQIDLFCVPQLADTACLEADHNGGYRSQSAEVLSPSVTRASSLAWHPIAER